jgi:DNA-directed RNA polymerase sigma subunit (sigma70/sigma32)
MRHYPYGTLRLLPGEKREWRQKLCVRTMQETASILGITVQSVQQTERNALNKLRFWLKRYKND